MNYQHLYAYLDSRPGVELSECMRNVVRIVRNGSSSIKPELETEEAIILWAHEVLLELTQLRAAQRVWIQQAVWNRFGCGPEMSDKEVTHLLLEPKVAAFLSRINTAIETEVNKNELGTVPTIPTLSVESPPCGSSTLSITSRPAGTFSQSPAVGNKRKRGHEEEAVKRLKWTDDMDSALREAIMGKEDPVDWSAVAEEVGWGVKANQCRCRWKNKLSLLELGMKQGQDWSTDELTKLHDLVPKYTTLPPLWNKEQKKLGESRVDWSAIGAALRRTPVSCAGKWNTVKHQTMKGGHFTAAEDALIRQRVAEWGDKGLGLWVSLEKEMNRPSGAITCRWNTLSLRKNG